jgi:hypothetical protein
LYWKIRNDYCTNLVAKRQPTFWFHGLTTRRRLKRKGFLGRFISHISYTVLPSCVDSSSVFHSRTSVKTCRHYKSGSPIRSNRISNVSSLGTLTRCRLLLFILILYFFPSIRRVSSVKRRDGLHKIFSIIDSKWISAMFSRVEIRANS